MRRQQPKDAFDILYTLRHYDGGTVAAISAFADELRRDNPAMPDALQCLKNHFGDESSSGPVRAAHFVHGRQQVGEPEDITFQRTQIRQDMVDGARLLLGMIEGCMS